MPLTKKNKSCVCFYSKTSTHLPDKCVSNWYYISPTKSKKSKVSCCVGNKENSWINPIYHVYCMYRIAYALH